MCSLGYCYMGSPIQRTSIHREMHVCIILLRPLLLVLLLFISRFISGLGCRYTRSVRKNGMWMWSSETAWTVLHHIIQYTVYTLHIYADIVHYRKKKLLYRLMPLPLPSSPPLLLSLWSLTHLMRKYRPTKWTLAICACFFLPLPFACSFVLLAISEVFCSSGKFEYSIYQHAKRFVAFNSEILAFCFELIHLSMRLNDCEILTIFDTIFDTNIPLMWLSNTMKLRNRAERKKERGGEKSASTFI